MAQSFSAFLASVKGHRVVDCLSARGLPLRPGWDNAGRLQMTEGSVATLDPDSFRAHAAQASGGFAFMRPGTVVIDLDRKDGKDGVAWFEQVVGPIADTCSVSTPGNGLHTWWSVPSGTNIPQMIGRVYPGVDTLGGRTAVTIPGSVTARGTYALNGDTFDPPPMPARLLSAIEAARRQLPSFKGRAATRTGLRGTATWRATVIANCVGDMQEHICASGGGYAHMALNKYAFKLGVFDDFTEADLEPLVSAAAIEAVMADSKFTYEKAWEVALKGFAAGKSRPDRLTRENPNRRSAR